MVQTLFGRIEFICRRAQPERVSINARRRGGGYDFVEFCFDCTKAIETTPEGVFRARLLVQKEPQLILQKRDFLLDERVL